MQDAEKYNNTELEYSQSVIQPNDILRIRVETLIPEAALAYNKSSNFNMQANDLELMKLDGYLVSEENTIKFPVLGEISVEGNTTQGLEEKLKKLLVDGGHLVDPTVYVRIINSKFTIIGEVNSPGTYNFTEQTITILQALGYANDLTINGKREDILVIRETNGVRNISHMDLTSADLFNSPYYLIKPNDVIVVNPNDTKVKSAGFIGEVGTILTIASLALSVTILLTR